jgi:glycolate oxidase
MMSQLFPDETLDLIRDFKTLFDPACIFNPGKLLPTGKGCLEIRQKAELEL